MDGYVVIETDLKTKKFDEKIKTITNSLEIVDQEIETLEEGKSILEEKFRKAGESAKEFKNDVENSRKEIELLQSKMAQWKSAISEGRNKELTAGLLQNIDSATSKIEFLKQGIAANNVEIAKTREEQQKIGNEIDKQEIKIQKQIAKREELNGKLEIEKQKHAEIKRESLNISDITKGIGNSISGVINKVARWGLAIFGIRGAYMAIRRAISIVSAENEGVANSFEQIRTVIAGALLPVVQTVINAITKIMVYINYLWKALTGKVLFNFANATKKASNNLKSGAGSSGKIANNLKEARKQLAGFDEMNVLNDNVAGAGGGGAGGGAGGIGDVDFPNIFDKLKNIKIPQWLETLAKILKAIKTNWKELLPIVGAFAAAILAIKIAPFLHAILGSTTALGQFKTGLALAAAGAVLLIGEIVNMMLNWDNMTTKQKVLSIALAALGAAFVALGYAIATGISVATLGIGALIAAVVAVVGVVVGYIAKLATEEKAIKSVKKAQDDLTAAKKKARDAENQYISAVDDVNEKHRELIRLQRETGISGKDLYNQVQRGTLDYQNMNNQQKEVYKAYVSEIAAQQTLKTKTNELSKAKENEKMKTWEKKLAIDAESGAYDKYKKSVIDAYQKGQLSANQAAKLISKSMTEMSKDSEKTFVKDIPNDVKKGIDPNKYRTNWQKFKSDWKTNLLKLSTKVTISIAFPKMNMLRSAWDGIMSIFRNNSTVEVKSKGKKSAKGAIVRLPRLAVGGVVNQPGRGVPLGGAITGERGAEGVIPLTDSQQMALLGEAIGRYITVNASITNTMNGRVISRELKKVQNEDNFAFNR